MTDSATIAGQYRDPRNLTARITLHERFSTNPLGMHPWLFAQMELPRAQVLEIGCGSGAFWARNVDCLPDDWTVVLTDASPGMVQEAKQRLAGSRNAFACQVADAQALPFPDESFDAVLAHFMLYHVPDRERALGEIARVLRPGGVLYAATNGRHHMREPTELAIRAGLLEQRALIADDAVEFGLENGETQLRPWFAAVELRRYEDALVVTETEPLLAYILSQWDVQAALDRLGAVEGDLRLQTLRGVLDEELAERGHIHITKDSGVFIARQPKRAL